MSIRRVPHLLLVGLVFLLSGTSISTTASAAGPEFLFPHESSAIRIRLELRVEDQPPDVAWDAFLVKWFDFFDRDANGLLSETEVLRVLPLPLMEQRSVLLDAKRFDANGDGQGSRAEIKAFYQQAGFNPVVATMRASGEEALRISEALFRQLDRDGNGTLAKAELDLAATLLNRLDENEDEVLTTAELLSLPQPPMPQSVFQSGATTRPADPSVEPHAILNVALGPQPGLPTVETVDNPHSPVETVASPSSGPFRLRLGRNFCTVILEQGSRVQSFKSARSFYLAQFRTTFGTKTPVTRSQLNQDPALGLIAEQYDVVERDGDGKLSHDELNAFLLLVEQGISSQTVAILNTHGRSLFEVLDQDHDGRLALNELNAAARILNGEQVQAGITREQIPIQFQLHLARGTPGSSFGPIPIPGHTKRPGPPTTTEAATGPRWFLSLDRNADGTVSPREFPGKPEQFQKLDRDNDGLISSSEAM